MVRSHDAVLLGLYEEFTGRAAVEAKLAREQLTARGRADHADRHDLWMEAARYVDRFIPPDKGLATVWGVF